MIELQLGIQSLCIQMFYNISNVSVSVAPVRILQFSHASELFHECMLPMYVNTLRVWVIASLLYIEKKNKNKNKWQATIPEVSLISGSY